MRQITSMSALCFCQKFSFFIDFAPVALGLVF
jgi:hypothetical protein